MRNQPGNNYEQRKHSFWSALAHAFSPETHTVGALVRHPTDIGQFLLLHIGDELTLPIGTYKPWSEYAHEAAERHVAHLAGLALTGASRELHVVSEPVNPPKNTITLVCTQAVSDRLRPKFGIDAFWTNEQFDGADKNLHVADMVVTAINRCRIVCGRD